MATRAGQAIYLKSRKESEKMSFAWANWVVPVAVVCLALIFLRGVMNDPQVLPVNKIRVHGSFINIDEKMLHKAIDRVVAGGYFNVDVEKVKEVVETLPWVSKASVRRVWPDTLSVNVVEQQPVAVSPGFGLINSEGQNFYPEKKINTKKLPVLDGTPSLNMEMIEKYHVINKLISETGRKLTHLSINPRHAIEVILDNNLKLVLGKNEMKTRLNRFVSIYKKYIAEKSEQIVVIDLRYTNGMAIRWKSKTNTLKGLRGHKDV